MSVISRKCGIQSLTSFYWAYDFVISARCGDTIALCSLQSTRSVFYRSLLIQWIGFYDILWFRNPPVLGLWLWMCNFETCSRINADFIVQYRKISVFFSRELESANSFFFFQKSRDRHVTILTCIRESPNSYLNPYLHPSPVTLLPSRH